MNIELKYGAAIIVGGLLLNMTPAHSTHLNDPPSPVVKSHNAIIPDVNINEFFVGNQIDYTGLLGALVTACNGSPETQLQTGPGIRVSNDATTSSNMGPQTQAGSSRDSSVGDFSNDFVIWDSVNQQPKNAAKAEVSGFEIKNQVGFDPGFSLRAEVEVIKTGKTSTVRTVDTTAESESEPFLPGQTLGAGPGVGGHEIVLYVKTGEPKTGIAICDQNGWEEFDGDGNIQYGFTIENVDLSVINRWMIFWAVEGVPLGLPAGSTTDPIVALCNTFDAEILEGDPVAIVLQVKQAAAEGGVTTGGLISCKAPARGCDTSEPGPPLVEESGNACSDGGSTNKVEPGFFATSIKSGGGASALTNSTTSSTDEKESCSTTIFGKRYVYGPPC